MVLLRFLIFGLLAGFMAAQTPVAPPEIPGEVTYIPFPIAIQLDGQLDDWADIPTITVDRGPMVSADPTENGSFTFGLAADLEHVYVQMTMPDQNIIVRQHGAEFWNEDSLEFYFNFSGSLETRRYQSGIFQVNINPGDIGNTDPAAVTVTGINSSESQVRAFVFRTEDGWGFEAAIPFPAGVQPEHGLEVGFQAQANGAAVLDRNVKLIWSKADTDDQSWQNPALFGRALFFEVGRTDIPMSNKTAEQRLPVTEEQPPAVRVNQLGYYADAPKHAVLAIASSEEIPWTLVGEDTGETVASGTTTVINKVDAASGDMVHHADFSRVTSPGTYILLMGDEHSPAFRIGDSLYTPLLRDALRYFYLNRSGIELVAAYAGEWARPTGHLSDSAVTCYQGTAADGSTWDGCDYTLDASGGWYDAGDYGKYVVNGGISVWTLLNLYERLPQTGGDATLNIPESGNGVPDLLDEVRWQMNFLLAMQVPEGQPLAGMAHHKLHDLQWAGIPALPPTTMDNNAPGGGRYLFPPSTAATLNLAATAAQCARIWREIDPAFANRCLTAAEAAWQAANTHPIFTYGNIPGTGGGNYDDDTVDDEFYWAAAELFITTGKTAYQEYLTESRYFGAFPGPFDATTAASMTWGDTAALGTLSLLTAPNALSEDERTALKARVVEVADAYLEIINREGYRVPLRTETYYWGSNSDVLNNGIVLATAYDLTGARRYLDAAAESMDYVLGRNALGFSFVSGYGQRSLQHPHHRFWANAPEQGYPPPPPGAVAGGPNGQPSDPVAMNSDIMGQAPARRYIDDIGSWSTNEVTINWNAPLVWLAAFLDARQRPTS